MVNQKERVIVLLGAGSVIEGTNVSTDSLTKNVIEATDSVGPLVQNIVNTYQELYGSDKNVSAINFALRGSPGISTTLAISSFFDSICGVAIIFSSFNLKKD